MNLLFLTQLFYPSLFGGGEYIFYLICKDMAKKGHIVHVITQRLKNVKAYEVVEGIHIHRVGPPRNDSGKQPPSIFGNFAYLLLAGEKAIKIIRKMRKENTNFDIIHSNIYVPSLAGQFCSKIYHIPHIVTFHDIHRTQDKKKWDGFMDKQDEDRTFYRSFLAKAIEKLILRMNVSSFPYC